MFCIRSLRKIISDNGRQINIDKCCAAKYTLVLILSHKIITWMLIGLFTHPWFASVLNNHQPDSGNVPEAKLFTGNAAFYLSIANSGYHAGTHDCAFYPLLPLLMRAGSCFANSSIAGLIISNICSLAGVYLFMVFILQNYNNAVAKYSVIYILVFPGAIFFSFIYTESVYILLTMIFFNCLYRGNYLGVAIAGFFLPLTKAIGIFCLAPLLVFLWIKNRPAKVFLLAYSPLLGYLLYFAIMNYYTGNIFAGFEAQEHFPSHPSIENILDLRVQFNSFMDVSFSHDPYSSALDRLLFICFLGCLPKIWKADKVLFAYSLFAGFVPAFSSKYYGFTRNIMMCFPVFIGLGLYLNEISNKWVLIISCGILCAIQILCILWHVNFMWVG